MSRATANAQDQRCGRLRSGFTSALDAVVAVVEGALSAVLVDDEGELVDFAFTKSAAVRNPKGNSRIEQVAIQGALWQLAARLAGEAMKTGLRELHVRAQYQTFSVRSLERGYAILLVRANTGSDDGVSAALAACATRVKAEARWGT